MSSPRPRGLPDVGTVWWWWLPAPDVRSVAVAGSVLDPAELSRAAAFRRPADRDRYLVAHVGLRCILADCVGADPADLVLTRLACPQCGEPHGRPALLGHPDLHFSLAHADDAAVCAVARSAVGVDVESVRSSARPSVRPAGAASPRATGALRRLHPAERAAVQALPPDEQPLALLSCWVRKEAYLKGTGAGLAAGLGRYVGLADRFAAAAQVDGVQPPAGWEVADLDVPAGHLGAVAVQGRPGLVCTRQPPPTRPPGHR